MRAMRWPAGAVLVAISLNGVTAYAEPGSPSSSHRECALAYENSQEHRGMGALAAARSELARCQQDDCPAFIRADCSRWSLEVEAKQPTVIFRAKRGGRQLSEVRVSTGDRVLAERLQDQAFELDPGTYDFRFETPGSAAVVRHAVIRDGDKNHSLQVEFAPPAPTPSQAPRRKRSPGSGAAAPSVATSHSEAASVRVASGPRVLPWTLFAVGVVGIGTGVGLWTWGRSQENDLRDGCAPDCVDSQLQAVRTKYLLGDISFGLGRAAVSGATFLLLRHEDSERAATTLPLTLAAGPSNLVVGYGARF